MSIWPPLQISANRFDWWPCLLEVSEHFEPKSNFSKLRQALLATLRKAPQCSTLLFCSYFPLHDCSRRFCSWTVQISVTLKGPALLLHCAPFSFALSHTEHTSCTCTPCPLSSFFLTPPQRLLLLPFDINPLIFIHNSSNYILLIPICCISFQINLGAKYSEGF